MKKSTSLYVNGKKFDPEHIVSAREQRTLDLLNHLPRGRYLTSTKLSQKLHYSEKASYLFQNKLFSGYWLQWDYHTRLWGNRASIKLLKRKQDELKQR